MRSYSPQWVWRCQSRGYRQLCSLWFEYDPCLNRKPPNDFKNCLTTLIRIRSTSVPKGGWTMIQIWPKKTPQWARHFANQMGIDSYVLFGSNTTYVWTGSPQVIILFTARFEYDHKPDPPSSYHVILQWKQHVHIWRRKKDRGPALLLIIIYTWLREICTLWEPVAQV